MDIKTVFVIAIATSRMIMPGMPKMNFPGMPDFTAPRREMTMNLTSDKKVDKSSKAQCAIPEGLKLGPKVDLVIPLPEKIKPGRDYEPEPAEQGREPEKMVIKIYWLCGESVPKGQPRVIDTDKIADTMKNMPKLKPGRFGGTFSAPGFGGDGSHAYWPEGENPIRPDSHAPGGYALTTNYCGGTDLVLTAAQDFLAPIEMTSPGKDVDLAKTVQLAWKPVPNALGYLLSAFGSKKNEMIIWTSSSDPDYQGLRSEAVLPSQVKTLIDNGVLLPAEKTDCRIPAGIFEGCKSPMLTVTAIGTESVQKKDGIETHVTVRSTAMMTLGKGGMMGEDMGEDVEEAQPDEDQTIEQASDSGDTSDSTESAEEPEKKGGALQDILDRAKDLLR